MRRQPASAEDSVPIDLEPDRLPPPRRPSPLVAALADAILEAHAKRTGAVPRLDGMVARVNGSAEPRATSADDAIRDRPDRPALTMIHGGRRTRTQL
jgi:hypothetical protein